jgi:hypothetical protein
MFQMVSVRKKFAQKTFIIYSLYSNKYKIIVPPNYRRTKYVIQSKWGQIPKLYEQTENISSLLL